MSGKRRGCRLVRECAAYLQGLVHRLLFAQRAQRPTAQRRDEDAVAAEGSRRMNEEVSGAALVIAMQASPCREVDIEPRRWRLPARDLTL